MSAATSVPTSAAAAGTPTGAPAAPSRGGYLVAASAVVLVTVMAAVAYALRRPSPSETFSGLEGPFGSSPWLRIRYDPAYSAPFESDYCRFLPVACSGFALEPFRAARPCSPR